MKTEIDFNEINRLEVIDSKTGRLLVSYLNGKILEPSLQDDGKTLKIFIKTK